MIYLNGKFVNDEEASVSVSDRGLLLGDGLFETIALWGGRALDLAAHWERLGHGASALGLPVPVGIDEIREAIRRLAASNHVDDFGVVRITLTRGAGPRGLAPPPNPEPTLVVTATPGLRPEDQPTPISATIVTTVRHPDAVTSRWKTLSYLDQVAALQEAQEAGFDDAILPNGLGGVAGASRANLFVACEGKLVTPPVEEGALPGVVRGALLDSAGAVEIEIVESRIDRQTIAGAQDAFLTNSLIGVQPLETIDRHRLEDRGAGDLVRRCLEWWSAHRSRVD